MNIKKSFFNRALACTLGLTVIAPYAPVVAHAEETTEPVYINVKYQAFESDGIKVKPADNITDEGGCYETVKTYKYEMPKNQTVNLIDKPIKVQEVKPDAHTKMIGESKEIDFLNFEGVTIHPKDARKYVAVDIETGGLENNREINLHYTRNLYSIYVDPMGGKNTHASTEQGGEQIQDQYNCYYGANIEKYLRDIYSSKPERGSEEIGTNKKYPDTFIDWHWEYRLNGHLHSCKCTINANNIIDDGNAEATNENPLDYLFEPYTINGKMPATDITFRAHYSRELAPIQIVYHLQNANDNNYSVIGKKTADVTPGAPILNYSTKPLEFDETGEQITAAPLGIHAQFPINLTAEASYEGVNGDGRSNIFITGSIGDLADVFLSAFNVPSGEKGKINGIIGTEAKHSIDITVEVEAGDAQGAAPKITGVELKALNSNQMFKKRFDWVNAKIIPSPIEPAKFSDSYNAIWDLPLVEPDGSEVEIGIDNAKAPVNELIEYDWDNLLKDGIIDQDTYDSRGYYSLEYCDAFQTKNPNGTIANKTASEVTTVNPDGSTVVNVYYTRNYYALQFHMAKFINGGYINGIPDSAPDNFLKYKFTAGGYTTKYGHNKNGWGVTGKNWAVATLTRSRHGYISTGETYDWRREGNTDPYNRLNPYDNFANNDGIFSWGDNYSGNQKMTPNYVFLATQEIGTPSIEIGGIKTTMPPRGLPGEVLSLKQTEYTVVARYGADISDYWPTIDKDKVKDASNKKTYNNNESSNQPYSFYTWHTNYDTLFHASRQDSQDIAGKYSSLDKDIIVQKIDGQRNDVKPQTSTPPTQLPNPPAILSLDDESVEFTMPEDIFTPESMDQEVNLGAEGEIEDFVVDENEMPDGSYFDPSEFETPTEDYGTGYLAEAEPQQPVEQASSNPTADSTTSRKVTFAQGSFPEAPVYLAAVDEGLKATDGFTAQVPNDDPNAARTVEKIEIAQVGFKHDLFASWNPNNRNWGHTYHYCFEDPNSDTKEENLNVEEGKIDKDNLAPPGATEKPKYWKKFKATYTYDNKNIELLAVDSFREAYGEEDDPPRPTMPPNSNPRFEEKEVASINSYQPNVAQSAPALKGYTLYYVGHTNNDNRNVTPIGDPSDIYMFYVPERYTVNYISYPGQNTAKQMTVKYGQLISEEQNIPPTNDNGELLINNRLTPFGNKYIWGGWYSDPGFTQEVDFDNSAGLTYEGNVNYYGKWELPKFTVTFNMNGFEMTDDMKLNLQNHGEELKQDKDNDQWILTGVEEGTKAEDLLGSGYADLFKERNDGAVFTHWEEDLTGNRYGFGASQYISKDLTVNACANKDSLYVCYILHRNKSKTYYTSITTALTDFSDDNTTHGGGKDYKIVMTNNVTENVSIDRETVKNRVQNKDIYIDFDGHTVIGDFNVASDYNLIGIDSKTDKFGTDFKTAELTYEFGNGYGGIAGKIIKKDSTDELKPLGTGNDKSKVETFNTDNTESVRSKYYDYSYVCVPDTATVIEDNGTPTQIDGWSFHRVYCDVWLTHVELPISVEGENHSVADTTRQVEFGFGTAYYGDDKAKEQIGNNIGVKMYNNSASNEMKENQFKYNVRGVFFANKYYSTKISANKTDINYEYRLAPTFTNYDSTSEGVGNSWTNSQSNDDSVLDEWVFAKKGFSLNDAINMIASRSGKHVEATVRYLGDPSQYSDTFKKDDSSSGMYSRTDVENLVKWQGIAKVTEKQQ